MALLFQAGDGSSTACLALLPPGVCMEEELISPALLHLILPHWCWLWVEAQHSSADHPNPSTHCEAGSLSTGIPTCLSLMKKNTLMHSKLHEADLLLTGSKVQQKPLIHCKLVPQGSGKLARRMKSQVWGPYLHHSWGTLESSLVWVLYPIARGVTGIKNFNGQPILGKTKTEPGWFQPISPYLRMLHSQHIPQLFLRTSTSQKGRTGSLQGHMENCQGGR